MAQLGIYKAISGVMSDIGAVGKDKEFKSKYGGYKFRGIDDVMNALHPAMVKNKIFVVPEILEQERSSRQAASGTAMVVSICKIKYTFYAEDGSFVEAIVIGEGMDTGDKATNKAMSIAFKYACFQVFCIPTEDMDDPDSERPELDEKKVQEKTKPKASTQKEQDANPSEKLAEEQRAEQETSLESKITADMLKAVRAEQERVGVTDKQIIARIKAEKVEEMDIEDFKKIMNAFKNTASKKE